MNRVVKMVLWYGALTAVFLNILGCASVKRKESLPEIQQLQARINRLEKQLKEKEDEIRSLESELMQTEEDAPAESKFSGKADTISCTPKNIQIALKNAGFYRGSIDGKIGKGTKKAIKDFQKSKGMAGDGIVGKKTWSALEKYF